MSTSANRIWLKDNPWPEGHSVKEIQFYGILKENGVYLHLEIKSENYYAKEGYKAIQAPARKHDEMLDARGIKDNWRFYASWLNYHACHIYPNNDLLLGNENNPFSINKFSNLELSADNPPPEEKQWGGLDFDNMFFHCYILGHDAVGHHHIHITSATDSLTYHIDWKGKIALTYGGDEAFKHSFEVQLRDLSFEGFKGQSRMEYRYKEEATKTDGFWYDLRKDSTPAAREKELRTLAARHTDIEHSELKFVAREHSDWLIFNKKNT